MQYTHKYDYLLSRVLISKGVTILHASEPAIKSRPKTATVKIFTASEKYGLIVDLHENNKISGLELNTDSFDTWAIFCENGKLYIITDYQTLKSYFPNCKSI